MKKALIAGALYTIPFLALAQGTLLTATNTVGRIINFVIPIVGAILVIYFFVGALGYVQAGGDEEKRTEARNKMIYSVIGMFVAFSIFGLVNMLRNTFSIGGEAGLTLPAQGGFFQF